MTALPLGKKKGSGAARVLRPGVDDPLAGVEYTGDLEADSLAELDALQSSFRDRKTSEAKRFTQATDSEFWVALCFESRAAKEKFLADFALAKFGDKYLDGDKVAELLRRHL